MLRQSVFKIDFSSSIIKSMKIEVFQEMDECMPIIRFDVDGERYYPDDENLNRLYHFIGRYFQNREVCNGFPFLVSDSLK